MSKVTKNSWKHLPFKTYETFEFNKKLSMEEFNKLKQGHLPEAMEDHWFMYCDEDSINWIRSWTGIQIFKGFYRIENNECIIYSVQINNNKDEYQPKSYYESLGVFEHLVDCYSTESKEKINKFWDRENELAEQIEEGKITKEEADEIRKKDYLESLKK